MRGNTAPEAGRAPRLEPVAIIGLACRVPGAADAGQFWRNLVGGVESLTLSTREEQAALETPVPRYMLEDPNFVPAAMNVDDHQGFDAAFFGMSAREAELRDPQHRMFLELAYTALEDAGCDATRFDGEIGVFGGGGAADYQWWNIHRNPAAFAAAGAIPIMVGNHPDYFTTFVSYKLNLRGPSVAIHTACSTSLVAVHVACESLRNGECDMAICGGVCLDFPVGWGYVYDDDGISSPDGHLRAFDARAAGTIWGDGGGAVVLKRLSDALADGDHVRALVLGNAVNNDGATKVGFSAPSQVGQAAVIAQALGIAGVDPRTVTYVEAHGTGTALGDPIEVAALASVFGRGTRDRGWCAIGSVKTNIGHLGPASGVASLIKTVLAIEHGLIPPSLNFETPNPEIDFASGPFYVNAALARWETGAVPRRAGVSSFGIGGTNAHVVLEEAPAIERARSRGRTAQLLQLSARTEAALASSVERVAAHLAEHPELDLADVAHTLRVGRRELGHRAALVAADAAAAALAAGTQLVTGSAGREHARVALLFSGQGAQYAGMGAGLYRAASAYRDALDECARLLRPEIGLDLRDLVVEGGSSGADETLRQTAYAQPALFAVEYALARLWAACGVEPAAMIGHSVGEYAAAAVAGVFELADALRVVAARGRLMQRTPPGSMLAVRLDEDDLRGRLPDGLSIAAVNGPRACVVAGPVSLVRELAGRLEADGAGGTLLRTSRAFHSPMMEPILGEFREVVAGVELRPPRLPVLSNVTGDWITPAEATDPSYWARHVRETVRFGACAARLLAERGWLLVECGPGRQLAGLAALQVAAGEVPPMASLPGPGTDEADLEVLYGTAGRLWTVGVPLDAGALGGQGRRVPLPTYPWERRRCWIEPQPGVGDVHRAVADMRAGPRPLDEWFAVPALTEKPRGPDARAFRRCLAFVDGAGGGLVAGLRAAGVDVVEVVPGSGCRSEEAGRRTLRPAAREDYDALLADLAAGGGVPERIVHAWTLRDAPARDADELWRAQDRGFFSLLGLVQALAAARPRARVHLDVVTAGAQDVSGADLVRPEHATVAGIARVVPLEAPWLGVRHIDADPAGDGPSRDGRLVAELLRDPGPAAADGAVVLRGGRRWTRRFETVRLPAPGGGAAAGLREGGAYLVTGGLGGIGISLAEDIACGFRAGVALLSRSGLPPRREWDAYLAVHGGADRTARAIAAVRRMEAAGARVLVLAADVCDPAALRLAREQVLAGFGRLDGIVHAAGVPGGGMAEVRERAAAERVLAPKLLGPVALREAFGDLPLDFVVLCSSVTALAGGFGQVDYCAANCFLDAYARSPHGWPARLLSVNWGSWLEVGMAAEAAAPAGFRALQRGDRVRPVDHPLITSRHAPDGDGLPWCSGVISPGTHWVLDEHRVAGTAVLPGTAFLESVCTGFEAAAPAPTPRHALELRDVALTELLSVPEGAAAEIRVLFERGADGVDFQVASLAGGELRTHARGSAAWVEAAPPAPADVDALRGRCPAVEERTASPSSRLLTFGPRWSNVLRTYRGDREALALLEAPPLVAGELDRWLLHPALLDDATTLTRTAGSYLPIGYGRIVVRGRLPGRFWSHVRYRDQGGAEILAADYTLLDEAGREVVAVTDYLLRRVDPEATIASLTGAAGVAAPRPPRAGAIAGAIAGAARGIRPRDGAEAFRRLLACDLGPQVIASAIPVDDVVAAARRVTHDTVEEELAAAVPAGPARAGHVAPRTELEATIAGLVGQVLGSERVGVEDSFFELGGNSLIAVQLIAMVRRGLGVRIPMRSLFERPTVAGVAALVERLRGDGPAAASDVTPVVSAGAGPRGDA